MIKNKKIVFYVIFAVVAFGIGLCIWIAVNSRSKDLNFVYDGNTTMEGETEKAGQSIGGIKDGYYTAYQFNVEEAAYESFTNFINAFYYYSNMNKFGLFLNTEFWDQAEIYEIVIDAYENTGHPRYKDMIYDIFKGFNLHYGTDWGHNEYNDDIMWMVIACARAYLLTGDEEFLKTAEYHFNLVWDRGWSDDLGGGIWWRTDNQTKNACINCPATIAACLLGEALGDESYYDKAVQIMNWVVANIYEDSTGHVYDAYDISGSKNQWASTYNQGTFIGSAIELHRIMGERAYLNDAVRAANYTIGSLVSNSILKSEGTGDGGLFKGIFIRYFTELIQQERLDKGDRRRYIQFMKYNGETLWLQGTAKPAVLFGPDWRSKPASLTGLTEQLSGNMLIEAMALLEKGEYLQ